MTEDPNTKIVCSHCWGVNRVPTSRLGDNPKCGGCKQLLFEKHSKELTAKHFDQFITVNEIPVLVDFWAPWCGPCVGMAPAFEQAARILEPRYCLAKVNIDAEPSIASRFHVQSIPTLCLFKRGKEVNRHTGALTEAGIVQWVSKAV